MSSATVTPQQTPNHDENSRKDRINQDLIIISKRSCPPNSTASFKGVGLYTHVTGSSQENPQAAHAKNQQTSDPVFLPIGGPSKLPGEDEPSSQISPDVMDVWKELQDAVNQEEKHMHQGGYNMEELKQRYGTLEEAANMTKGEQTVAQAITQILGRINHMKIPGTQNAAATSQPVRRTSTYDVERDPRLKNRNL